MNGTTQELAGRGMRLGAAIIDAILMIILLIPVMLLTDMFQQAISGQELTLTQKIIGFVAGWVIFLILHGYLLLKKGQTIGKMILKIKIVDLQGNLPNFGKLLTLRYLILSLLAQIPVAGNLVGLIDVLFIFGKERRCIHDYLAGTRVVNV
ncbi:MAG: RDD family protein [Candidatus Zixiibacteriota bacterium]|nr:MAG: RDD family protein [candidate division Zixibacteria bacterium]